MFFKYNHISIYYEKYGKGNNTILILPGWGNTRNTFQHIINYFKEKYTIYILDYPGFGNSQIPNKELTMEDYTKLIISFIKENNINNPIIIAHSFGGRITSLLLTKYKISAKKLILFDVAGIKRRKKNIKFIKKKIYKLLKKIIPLFPKIKQEEIKQKLLIKFSSEDYKNIPACMRKTFQNIIQLDLRNYYKKINTETLIIWGEQDQDTPLKDAYYLQNKIKNNALIIYPKATHFSYLQYPLLTNSIIESFLNN